MLSALGPVLIWQWIVTVGRALPISPENTSCGAKPDDCTVPPPPLQTRHNRLKPSHTLEESSLRC
jgi:hypothetical protein